MLLAQVSSDEWADYCSDKMKEGGYHFTELCIDPAEMHLISYVRTDPLIYAKVIYKNSTEYYILASSKNEH